MFELEERTIKFAKSVRDYSKVLPNSPSNIEYTKQLIRSSASIGANYIEANESLGRKDFKFRLRIAKKEAKECRFWLRLTEPQNQYKHVQEKLTQESVELMSILGAILKKAL